MDYIQYAIADYIKGNEATGQFKYLVHQGGTSSSKTVTILQALAEVARRYDGLTITVAGQTAKHLKDGAQKDFIEFAYPYYEGDITKWHRTDRKFTYRSKSIMQFNSYDSYVKALGGKRHILYINEGNALEYRTFFELDKRTSIITIIDYNPAARFWAHDELLPRDNSLFIYSDHRDNPYLTKAQHREIENIKDPELWKVYARGATGNIEGLIYDNWIALPNREFFEAVKDVEPVFGVDFGYSSASTADPTAIVKAWKIGNNLYFHELLYEVGASPKTMASVIQANGYDDNCLVRCDYDEDMIYQLRNYGVLNALYADKGQYTLKAGIVRIKDFNVYYSMSSKNIANEVQRYTWMVDKQTGRTLSKPIDKFNHLMDACRYAIYIKSY